MKKNGMNNDLDKLAAEMRKMKASKPSRDAAMKAAMSAFDQEFSVESPSVAKENIESAQGLNVEARPTGQKTRDTRVSTFGRDVMAKFNSLFTFKPQTMMMAGSCAAALIAGLIVLPNMGDFSSDEVAAPMAPVAQSSVGYSGAPVREEPEKTAPEVEEDEIVVTGLRESLEKAINEKRADTELVGVISAEDIGQLPDQNMAGALEAVPGQDLEAFLDAVPETPPAPVVEAAPPAPMVKTAKVQRGITSVDSLLNDIRQNSAEVNQGNRQREQKFRQSAKNPRALINRRAGRAEIRIPGSANPKTRIEQIGGLTLEEVPAEYKVETKEVVSKEAVTEYITTPAEFETVTEQVVVQEAATELVTIPATRNPDGTIATPARTTERSIPSVTKTETRRVIKTPASTVEITVPAGTIQHVEVRTEISPQKFYLRDEDGVVIREFNSRDEFEKYQANLTTVVAEKPVSTFSVDVDTASYSFLRASINRGQLPPRSAIRLEEMINYFPYDYEAPKTADEPFKANVTVTQNPWNVDTKLMHIGIKGYVPKETEKPRSNIVFLIDTSGSMNQENKLPLLINSFKLLLNSLDEDDTVSIVAYASASGTVLEPTPVSEKSEILSALNRLRAGGSTAGAAGLELAYQKAEESFDDEGVNRVILATDGDFNVGFSSPDEMKTYIKQKRDTGVFLSVLGFGMGNYNDHLMQSLAQNGNGVAAYIDTLSEANKVLANEAGSALFTIAKDVKIQVEFNPATVAEYRLIGYETRALKRQDFNNDKVDAGEIGAGHSVTAIYEMTPVGSPAISVDKLRYASDGDASKDTGSDEFAFVKIRHKLPTADKSTLQTFPVGKRQERRMSRASDDMRFATAVAAVGQKLRGDTQLEDYSYADAIKLANSAKGDDENGYRAEFVQMVKLIKAMER